MADPQYFPIERGLYEVVPGLRPLGYSFGQGDWDKKIFQVDSTFKKFRENKIRCRQERLGKYFCTQDLSQESRAELSFFLMQMLSEESPDLFKLSKTDKLWKLECQHTGDGIKVDAISAELREFTAKEPVVPGVEDTLDALALQIPEDIALTQKNQDGDAITFLHLCSPSHWAAEDKIGLSFLQVHRPVPGIDRILKTSSTMVDAMIHKGPFVRFVWSFVTDERLNHHPVAPPNLDEKTWKGRSFDLNQAVPFYFRVERQVVFGLPKIQGSLFTIRVSFISGLEIKKNEHQRQQLLSALNSMTPEARVYKGVASCFDELVHFLS